MHAIGQSRGYLQHVRTRAPGRDGSFCEGPPSPSVHANHGIPVHASDGYASTVSMESPPLTYGVPGSPRVSARSRHGRAGIQTSSRSSLLTWSSMETLIQGCFLTVSFVLSCCLAWVILVRKPPFKGQITNWKEEGSPRIGRSVLSTFSTYLTVQPARPVSRGWKFTQQPPASQALDRQKPSSKIQVASFGSWLGPFAPYMGMGKGQQQSTAEDARSSSSIPASRRPRKLDLSQIPERRPRTLLPLDASRIPKRNRRKHPPSLALCLIGGARDFQLTGPTLSRHLLSAYPDSDAFVLSPLDDNSHKLSMLVSMVPNLVLLRVAADVPVNQSVLTDRLLAAIKGGPETPEAHISTDLNC